MAVSKLTNGGSKSKSGTATPAVVPEQQAQSTLPPVVGINFGNSYASIAVFTKEGVAECIANEDGERQIACAISFHGEELYIGNQAKHQLVKNANNTITGFRNLLGKKFSEIQPTANPTSAPVIQHPTEADQPAYSVTVLQPSPAPLPTSTPASSLATPLGSVAPTPRSEPISTTRILTPLEATSIFLRSLIQSAEDFLGKKIEGAVLTVPEAFTPAQHDALLKAASDAGITVLQLLDDAGATAATTTSPSWSADSPMSPDRTQLIVDAGASSLSLSLLSIRHGLAYVLASSHSDKVQPGNQIDDALVKHFAAEFTKKTKVPFTPLAEKPNAQDARAEAKLRLALEHTKRTISASPGGATCSVESLKEGMDFNSSLNRLRFDMLARPVYTAISNAISSLLEQAGLDAHDVDELVYVGGTACLPGLDEHIQVSVGLREDVESPFARGTVIGGGVGDPTTVISRGCAIQAELIASLTEDQAELKAAFARDSNANDVKATSKTLGLFFPSENPEEGNGLGGAFVPAIAKETALPARRIITFDVSLPESEPKKFGFELVEVTEGIRIEKVKPPPMSDAEDDEEEEEEELEIKHRTLTKSAVLGSLVVEAKLGIKATGKLAKEEVRGSWATHVQATVVVGVDGAVQLEIVEVGEGGAKASLNVEAP